ncbi:MAG: hypothetical protein V4727_12865 [Verrucomicrobiota bacterium]
MLHFFVTKRGGHTFKTYLSDWAGKLRTRIAVHFYEDSQWPAASSATYIFTDLERLSPGQFDSAVDYAKQLQLSGANLRILNSPERVLRRLDLLTEMSRIGINRFRAFRLREMPEDFRFPGFLRMGQEHNGAASPLLQNLNDLVDASNGILAGGGDAEDILAVEFCDTRSPDGCYRKYSFFRIADAIIPAHIIFSPYWVAKDSVSNAEQVAEEDLFHSQSPHASWARGIFEAAAIDYGRIDFSLCPDGTPQVWEINTNPVLLARRAKYEAEAPLELPRKELLAVRLGDVLKSLIPANANPLFSILQKFLTLSRICSKWSRRRDSSRS